MHSRSDGRCIVTELITASIRTRRVDVESLAYRSKRGQLFFSDRNAREKIQPGAIDMVAFQYLPYRFFRLDRDIARYDPHSDIGCFDPGFHQRRHGRKQARLAAIDFGPRMFQLLTTFLVELSAQVLGKLAQPTQIFEQLAPTLEAAQVANIHSM